MTTRLLECSSAVAVGALAGWERPPGPAELQDGSQPPQTLSPRLNIPSRRERSCTVTASHILPELVKGKEQGSDSSSRERFRHPALATTHLKT